jgi:DNA-3-methyladenine glycosylase II
MAPPPVAPRKRKSSAPPAAPKAAPKAAAIKSRARAQPARVIAGDADVLAGVRALRRKCQIMRHVHDTAGDPPLRLRPAGFEGLCRVIAGQQLSVASATAIWNRTEAAVRPFSPRALLALSDAELAAAGLSRPKIRTLRAIAEACANGLNLAKLARASDEEVHAALTQVVGIGPWTADVYIMFCLGRADAWAPGDLALQIAAQRALGLAERPTAEELRDIAERWRPWRGVAARLLWAYYAATKQKAAVTAVPV